jgi:hypothetical protein
LNSEKTWKIQKKIVKRYAKYGRKIRLKRYKKIWNISRLNSEMIWKIWKKHQDEE